MQACLWGFKNGMWDWGRSRVWFREQKSRRRPSLISQVGAANAIPKATNLNSEIHKSFCHFRSGEQESRWGVGGTSQQDPSPAQTGTDQLRTEYWSSSVNLFLVPFLIFFLIWLPLFSSIIHSLTITCSLLKRYHYLELHSTGILRTHVVLRAPNIWNATTRWRRINT